jgi:hypothetical protein
MADAETAQAEALQPEGVKAGTATSAAPDAAADQPPAISNKLGLDEALLHRRSLLMALVLLKEDSRCPILWVRRLYILVSAMLCWLHGH